MSTSVAWALLVLAGLFEVGWALGLKYTAGFTRPLPTLLTVGAMIVSMGLLGLTARQLPIGTAYAVWTGIGVFGTAIAGIYLLGESTSLIRMLSLTLILCGIIGLKITG
ncbi:MAG TPA: quaternary ammonium compound efflux SMR transporter SugE [Gammaproteobacteria bacterium]|nr:quaternary ammonium compound efflux SMR transporter SugE [Gammaproteobacteria bacterium]